MRSPNIRYIPELDQLRGLAAVLVLYFHSLASASVVSHYLGTNSAGVPLVHNAAELIIANGFSGVALFFVISGFLFTWGALQTDRVDWRIFYTNRVLRIFPMYLLLILATYAFGRGDIPFLEIIQTTIGFGNYNPPHNDFDVVLWTISLEIQFYLIFPFLVSLLKRQGARYFVGIIAVLICLRAIAWADHMPLHNPVYWTLFGRLDQFLIGMMLAWGVYHRGWLNADRLAARRSTKDTVKTAAAMAGTVGVMLLAFWGYHQAGWKYTDGPIQIIWPTIEASLWAAFGICYVALVMHWHPKVIKPVQFAGMISYSLYLLHYPIVKALNQSGLLVQIPSHVFAGGVLSTTLQILPVSIMIASLTYYTIEKPPLAWRRRYTAPTPGVLTKA